jgi:phenylpropionate dioxygenase-like ring-hydroxylating dioxygenase large terminal subunit
MLSSDENETLTRVGANTPMGRLLRRYWHPLMLSEDLAEVGSRPVRVRLLGEDLVAFRSGNGEVGLVGSRCPHRGAPLAFARTEESGLRCVYHGWKFDVLGNCIDMPNEPPTSTFKTRIHHLAYPCVENGGIIWAYLGVGAPPPSPAFEWATVPSSQRIITKQLLECNYAQALEGDLDSSHVSFLHSTTDQNRSFEGTELQRQMGLMADDTHPHLETLQTSYGMMVGARREADPTHYHWRVTQMIMPYFVLTPPFGANPLHCNAWIPVDDRHTMVWRVSFNPARPLTAEEINYQLSGKQAHVPPDGYATTDNSAAECDLPGSQWLPRANRRNDYEYDEGYQRSGGYSGIRGFWAQDRAMVEGMGDIFDRSTEHLGTSDAAVIQVRRLLLNAARQLADDVPPPGQSTEGHRIRSISAILERDADWLQAFESAVHAPAGTSYSSV